MQMTRNTIYKYIGLMILFNRVVKGFIFFCGVCSVQNQAITLVVGRDNRNINHLYSHKKTSMPIFVAVCYCHHCINMEQYYKYDYRASAREVGNRSFDCSVDDIQPW